MTTDAELDPRRWRALSVCLSAMFMTLLDVSIVAVALPSIGKGTGAGPAELQWVVSGYALAFGMVPIIGGRLGDDRGRKQMLLLGIAGFIVTSAAVGLAPVPSVLIGARVLQGLFGGLINPQISGLVQQLFPLEERGRAFGAIGTVVGVSTAAGPVVGGLIIAAGGEHLGWRLCFLINVPVGIAAFALCRAWLPDTPRRDTVRSLDLPGAALLALGVAGLLFPAVEYDADHDARLALIVMPALAVLATFVWWERGPGRRRGHPLIDLALFKIRSFADGVTMAVLFFCAYTGTPLVLALFLQDGLGFSALHSGLIASAYAIGSAASAPIGGRLVSRIGRQLIVGALTLFATGVGGAALLAVLAAGHTSPTDIALLMCGPLFVAGLGGGSVITPNQALSLADVNIAGGSTAGGVLQTGQRIGNAIGAAVITAVFYAAASSAPAALGPQRQEHYGHAYALALLVSVAFALAALALAIYDVRRSGPDEHAAETRRKASAPA